MYAFKYNGIWKDIGTPKDYLLANHLLLKHNIYGHTPIGFKIIKNY